MSLTHKNDIFNDVFNNTFIAQYSTPRANITRQKNGLLLEVELPGFSRSDISLDARNGVLTVTTTRTADDREYERREFGSNPTKRSWTLPREVDPERIDATYEAGILSIDIPYRSGTSDNHRKIEIR